MRILSCICTLLIRNVAKAGTVLSSEGSDAFAARSAARCLMRGDGEFPAVVTDALTLVDDPAPRPSVQ
jgi:hypothetical protein